MQLHQQRAVVTVQVSSASEREEAAVPGGLSAFERLLDADGDGDGEIADDVTRAGGQLLGQLFRR